MSVVAGRTKVCSVDSRERVGLPLRLSTFSSFSLTIGRAVSTVAACMEFKKHTLFHGYNDGARSNETITIYSEASVRIPSIQV